MNKKKSVKKTRKPINKRFNKDKLYAQKMFALKFLVLLLLGVLLLLATIYKNNHISVETKDDRAYNRFVKLATHTRILDVSSDKDNVYLTFNKKVKCSLDKKKYTDKNQTCTLKYSKDMNIVYIKTLYDTNIIFEIKDYINVINKVSEDKIYIAKGATEDINYLFNSLYFYEIELQDDGIISMGKTGILTGNNVGNTSILLKSKELKLKIDVVVTDLIAVKGNNFNYDKPYLSCGVYSKEDNDLLDKILESRVNRGGYLTRAGAVEAARFLTMEFPYRINYFSENGRMADWPKADGEGRYYHKGLYLDSSRFDVLNKDYIMNGPNPWGCPIHSNPAGGTRLNGLDCSGFISWAVHQAGFDPGDIGAGVDYSLYDFTDLGTKERVDEVLEAGTLKVGDLLSGDGEVSGASNGGHIAMLIGIKDGYYYVAEELWGRPSLSHGAVAMKYSYDDFKYYFYWRINMDEYYKEDGNLTTFWN